MCRGSRMISLKQIHISKIAQKARGAPCHGELDAYLNALHNLNGDEKRIPQHVSKSLEDCQKTMFDKDITGRSLGYHLAKFIDRNRFTHF